MASVDGSKSLLAASDELCDNICGPCKSEGNKKEARQYCVDCSEYLCGSCVNFHGKLPTLKHHKIVSANTVSVGTSRRLTIYCGCNKNKEVEFYCAGHADVICSPCKNIKHHKCETTFIHQKSSAYTSTMLDSVLSKTKSLKDKYDQLKQECSENQNELKRSKEARKKEIKAFRKELDDFLNKLEQRMLEELDQYETKKQELIDQHMTTLTTVLQMLDADCQLVENARKDGRKQVMFAAEVQASKTFHDCGSRLADLAKDVVEDSLTFEKNKKLVDLQKDIISFGSLRTKDNDEKKSSSEKFVFLNREIVSRIEVNVHLDDDKREDCWISGCTVMPNGYVLLCDRRNGRLKLLDNSFVFKESLSLPGLMTASIVDPSTVIVSNIDKKHLQYVDVFPHLKAGRTIRLERECWGVSVCGDKMYTPYCDAKQEIRVLDLDGNPKGPVLRVSWPRFVTVNISGTKVFASSISNSITCMTTDGKIIYQYKDGHLRDPRNICCDFNDNILVCDWNSNTVQVITTDGKKYGTLLSSSDGLKYPSSVAYRENDDSLIVGCEGTGKLFVFKLGK